MPDTDLPAGHRGATDTHREISLLAAALCRCEQFYGRHSTPCLGGHLLRFNPDQLAAALTAHDRRVTVEAEAFCVSCGEQLDPANMLRLNGIPYHLGNCPRPHGDT